MAVSIEQVLQKAKRLAKKGQNELAAEQYKSILEAFPIINVPWRVCDHWDRLHAAHLIIAFLNVSFPNAVFLKAGILRVVFPSADFHHKATYA